MGVVDCRVKATHTLDPSPVFPSCSLLLVSSSSVPQTLSHPPDRSPGSDQDVWTGRLCIPATIFHASDLSTICCTACNFVDVLTWGSLNKFTNFPTLLGRGFRLPCYGTGKKQMSHLVIR